MPSDYKAIKEENRKEYGRIENWGPRLLDDFYSYRAHFVDELLQNAEDAGATEVKFRLHRNCLELEHNGCPFTVDDVLSICGLADSTKPEDPTKIGKFGMGFKSVYVHTRSPEIHSEDEHFAIDNYVHPRLIRSRSSDLGTLFVFPFNHKKKDPDESFDEISRRLKDLGTNTLLFLKNIKSISYEIDEVDTGSYRRKTSPLETNFAREVTVVGQSDQREEEYWLVFESDIEHDQIPEDKRLTVEIAFQYSNDDSQDPRKFKSLSQSNLVVSFPTKEETHLGFLVQGPYITTLSRESILDEDDFNIALAEQTGALVVEALRWLRDRNWLTVDVLNTMPLKSYEFEDTLFEPIYNKVRSAIENEPLIPAYKEGYVSGNNAKLAGSEILRVLLNGPQLQEFFDNEQLRWVSGEITEQRRTSALRSYLIHHVDIEEIDAEDFARKIDKKDFLGDQSDDWVREFYEFASGRRVIRYILESKPIIRLEDGRHVAPFQYGEPQAYLPTEHDSQFETVKREVCNSDKAMEFLRNLGLKKPDIVDEVTKLILPKYEQGDEINDEEHKQDITVIVKALNEVPRDKEDELIRDLKRTSFLLATNVEGVEEFHRPTDIYFRSPELEMYFEGNPAAWFLASRYKDYAKDFKETGVAAQVRVKPKTLSGDVHVPLSPRYNPYAYRRGKHGFNPGCSIEGLEFALKHPNLKRAKFIWNYLLKYQRGIVGIVEESSRQDFSSAGKVYSKEEQVSKMGKLVRERAWLPNPNKHGEFVVPREITLDELPDNFSKDKQLAAKLGMNASYEAIVAELQGREDIPEELKQAFKSTLELKQKCPELLDNPEELNKYMRWRESTAKQTTSGDNSVPGEEVKQQSEQRLKKADQYKELERKCPEKLAKLIEEAATEQTTNGDNSIPGSADSPGHLGGTGNVPHNESRTVRQSSGTHINNGSQLERHDIEKAAMDAVMQKEKDLGNTPHDVSNKRGLGYDIESCTPEGNLRYIEVKGHSNDDGSVTLTRNEMRCALNNPQQFILALVKVVNGCPESPRYLPGNSWLESVTFYSLQKLLELCQDPS